MRVSVKKTDIGYVDDPMNYEVSLDGEILKNCITADEEEGMVIVYDTDKKGGLVPGEKGCGPVLKTLRGKVTIEGPE